MDDEPLIKWFKFSDDELRFLMHALASHEDNRWQYNIRLQDEIHRVLMMRASTPAT